MKDCFSDLLRLLGKTPAQVANESRIRACTVRRWMAENRKPQLEKVGPVSESLGVNREMLVGCIAEEEAARKESLPLRHCRLAVTFGRLLYREIIAVGDDRVRVLKRLKLLSNVVARAIQVLEGQLAGEDKQTSGTAPIHSQAAQEAGPP